jgi:hypothetical protein
MNKKCISIDSVKRKTECHSFKTRLDGRPGPRLGFWVLTGSLGRLGQFFFKSKRCRFSKKKITKSQRVYNRILSDQPTGLAYRLFSSLVFFESGPLLALNQLDFELTY